MCLSGCLVTTGVVMGLSLFVAETRSDEDDARRVARLQNLGGLLQLESPAIKTWFRFLPAVDGTQVDMTRACYRDQDDPRILSRVGEEVLEDIIGLPNVTSLNLSGCRIFDVGASRVAEIEELDELNLCCTDITDEGLNQLAQLTNLQRLDIADTKVTREGVRKLMEALPNCILICNFPEYSLLRNVEIERPNQVWSTDITYIPLQGGYVYLTAVIDWYSRYVLTWRLSNSLDSKFCIEALEEALASGQPEIFNTDQGVQFTSTAFTGCLESRGVAISMDGRGRALDNVFVERLWRTVKYEEVYLKDYDDAWHAENSLREYFDFYCHERRHQALDYRTPAEVYGVRRTKSGVKPISSVPC